MDELEKVTPFKIAFRFGSLSLWLDRPTKYFPKENTQIKKEVSNECESIFIQLLSINCLGENTYREINLLIDEAEDIIFNMISPRINNRTITKKQLFDLYVKLKKFSDISRHELLSH